MCRFWQRFVRFHRVQYWPISDGKFNNCFCNGFIFSTFLFFWLCYLFFKTGYFICWSSFVWLRQQARVLGFMKSNRYPIESCNLNFYLFVHRDSSGLCDRNLIPHCFFSPQFMPQVLSFGSCAQYICFEKTQVCFYKCDTCLTLFKNIFFVCAAQLTLQSPFSFASPQLCSTARCKAFL